MLIRGLSAIVVLSVFQIAYVLPCTCQAGQRFCSSHEGKGGCLVITRDGKELLFANEHIGHDEWETAQAGDRSLGRSFKEGGERVPRFVTVDEEGSKVYLAKEREQGSYWEYTFTENERGKYGTTIKTAKPLKGGPYYLVPDFDHPIKRVGPKQAGRPETMEYIVYPVKVTTRIDDPGVKMITRFLSP